MVQCFAQGPIAQWLEQAAHNGLVAGSNPAGSIFHAKKRIARLVRNGISWAIRLLVRNPSPTAHASPDYFSLVPTEGLLQRYQLHLLGQDKLY